MTQDTNSFQKYHLQGTRLLQQGDTNAALPLLEKAHELHPENADVMLNLSSAYILTKKFKQAAALLEQLIKIDAKNAMFWMNLGAAYLGNPALSRDAEQKKAIAAFETALDLNPNTPNVAYNIGLIYIDRKEYDTAEEWFKRALQTNPDDSHARQYIGQIQQIKAKQSSSNG